MVDPEVRETIGLPPDEEEFALLDTGIKRQVVVARPDSFLNGNDLKFLEFNSDSPAGVVPGRCRLDRLARGGFFGLADHE
jgi:hypothetical protein